MSCTIYNAHYDGKVSQCFALVEASNVSFAIFYAYDIKLIDCFYLAKWDGISYHDHLKNL